MLPYKIFSGVQTPEVIITVDDYVRATTVPHFHNKELTRLDVLHVKGVVGRQVRSYPMIWNGKQLGYNSNSNVVKPTWNLIGYNCYMETGHLLDVSLIKKLWQALKAGHLRYRHRMKYNSNSTWQFQDEMNFLDASVDRRLLGQEVSGLDNNEVNKDVDEIFDEEDEGENLQQPLKTPEKEVKNEYPFPMSGPATPMAKQENFAIFPNFLTPSSPSGTSSTPRDDPLDKLPKASETPSSSSASRTLFFDKNDGQKLMKRTNLQTTFYPKHGFAFNRSYMRPERTPLKFHYSALSDVKDPSPPRLITIQSPLEKERQRVQIHAIRRIPIIRRHEPYRRLTPMPMPMPIPHEKPLPQSDVDASLVVVDELLSPADASDSMKNTTPPTSQESTSPSALPPAAPTLPISSLNQADPVFSTLSNLSQTINKPLATKVLTSFMATNSPTSDAQNSEPMWLQTSKVVRESIAELFEKFQANPGMTFEHAIKILSLVSTLKSQSP